MVAYRPRASVARAVFIVLGLFAVLLGTPAMARAAEPGAVASITWGESRADVDRDVAMLQASGARYVRTNVNWSALEPDRKGTISSYTLGEYDYAIDRARAAGLKVIMPVADGVPYWASADPAKHVDAGGARRWDKFYPPANYADYGDIVRFVVSHFAARGVHVYEMWNEPNLSYFWSSGPNAAEYVKMLKAGYTAAKSADPDSTVLLGGLSKNDFAYLEQVYQAGGGPYFDAAAVHPYTYGVDPTVAWNGANADEDHTRISKYAFPGIKEIRRTMEAHGDSGKGVWITEFGYSTTTHDGGVSEATQAAYLTKAYQYVEQFPWLKVMLWYSARNTPWNGDADDYESRFGLATTDWRLKPSYEAFKAYAGGSPSSTTTTTPSTPSTPTSSSPPPSTSTPPPAPSPVPANAAPTVRLTSPAAGSLFQSSLALAADASDDVAVTRVEFRVDGRLVSTDTSAPYAVTWKAPRKLALGAHEVTATAFDAAGRSARAAATVTRVAQSTAIASSNGSGRVTAAGRTLLVTGRLPGRARAAVVQLRRRDAKTGRWRVALQRRAKVHGARYRLRVTAAPGRWQVRVVFRGRAGRRTSVSRFEALLI